MNQAKGFREEDVGSHDEYLDALFNRGQKTSRQIYDKVTGQVAMHSRYGMSCGPGRPDLKIGNGDGDCCS
jgi:hypothetical protein